MNRYYPVGLVAAVAMLAAPISFAHGDASHAPMAHAYTPSDASRMGGKLTVLNGTQKEEAELKPAGGNKLEAGQVKVAAGSKVVASVKGTDGKATTVRFAVK